MPEQAAKDSTGADTPTSPSLENLRAAMREASGTGRFHPITVTRNGPDGGSIATSV